MPLVCLSSRGVVYDLSGSGASERWTSNNNYITRLFLVIPTEEKKGKCGFVKLPYEIATNRLNTLSQLEKRNIPRSSLLAC